MRQGLCTVLSGSTAVLPVTGFGHVFVAVGRCQMHAMVRHLLAAVGRGRVAVWPGFYPGLARMLAALLVGAVAAACCLSTWALLESGTTNAFQQQRLLGSRGEKRKGK